MSKYIVEIYQLHSCCVEIEADSQDEAVEFVLFGKGDPIPYSLGYVEFAEHYCGADENGNDLPDGIASVKLKKDSIYSDIDELS